MAKFDSDWLIASTEIPDTTIEIDDHPYEFAAGHWYLYHKETSLSLISTLQTYLQDVEATCYLARDRRVRILGFGALSITWPAAFAALFGFTGSLSGQSSYTAPSVSPLLWSSSKPMTPQESPLGTLGRRDYDTRLGMSPDQLMVADSHHTQVVQTFACSFVPTDRFQTAAQDTGQTGTIQGEYTRFFEGAHRAEKFHYFRGVLEDTSSSDPVDYPASLGPYSYRQGRGSISADFVRASGFKVAERRVNVSIDCVVVDEWGEV